MSRARYQCKKCLHEIVMDVPMSESAPRFGDKVPCTKCGQVGCRWKGSA